jgi:hypothetical protein
MEPEARLNVLVTHAARNLQRVGPFVDQERGSRMPQFDETSIPANWKH